MVKRTVLAISLASAIIACLTGATQIASPGAMTQGQIVQAFVGNTIVSTSNSPSPFAEFHAPRGQVYGNNSGVANLNSCWQVTGNQICYNYGGGPACYSIVKQGNVYSFYSQGVVIHAATVQLGDPRGLQNRPRTWNCSSQRKPDGIVSLEGQALAQSTRR
jgi:hypothetical protein